MRVGKGVAVEAGVDGDGTDLIDDGKLPYVHVHVGLLGELPLSSHDGQTSLHWPTEKHENQTLENATLSGLAPQKQAAYLQPVPANADLKSCKFQV